MIDLQPTSSFIALLSTELHDLKRSAEKRSYRAGEIIFKQGDSGDGVYVVDEGGVDISASVNDEAERVLSHLGVDTFFGEMAVLDGQPRSATAIAREKTVVSFIPRDEMLRALAQSPPLLASLVREFSLRTRQFDRRYINEILEAERLTLIGRFAQSIVHDFKNPLNIVGWAADLVALEDVPPEHRVEASNQIKHQLNRMTNMINELLEFTRGSSRAITLEPTEYRAFVAEFLAAIIPEAGEKSVKIAGDPPPPGLMLALDRSRLLQVFYNLVNNAIDMMPDGGTITLRFCVSDAEVVTELEDTGPGLAPEIQARLFQPFATHGKKHGTGLGLSICKRIVEDHRGHIHARSEPGRGAVFSFTIPRPASESATV